jgi:hypothetical protein
MSVSLANTVRSIQVVIPFLDDTVAESCEYLVLKIVGTTGDGMLESPGMNVSIISLQIPLKQVTAEAF